MVGEVVLREPEVVAKTGISRTSIWRLERRGGFPARREITPGSVGWLSSEVDEWLRTRPVRAFGGARG